MLLTDASQTRRPLVDVVSEAVSAGVTTVVVREKHLPEQHRSSLLSQISDVATPAGCLVIAASRSSVPVDGLHLAADEKTPIDRPTIVGRSCHSFEEVQAAERQGCDYVTLSPIFLTQSKPGYGPALGTDFLHQVARSVSIPIVALGGVDSTNARSCITAGASGVAVMGTVMRSSSVDRTVRLLGQELAESSMYPDRHD